MMVFLFDFMLVSMITKMMIFFVSMFNSSCMSMAIAISIMGMNYLKSEKKYTIIDSIIEKLQIKNFELMTNIRITELTS